jgi:hypothetical protein
VKWVYALSKKAKAHELSQEPSSFPIPMAAAQCNGRRVVRVGDKIKLAMDLNHLHLFDAVTQKSIY